MAFTVESASYILIIINVIFSYQGFNRFDWKDKYIFSTERILTLREYYRMVSSGFLHADWIHLILNMYVLYMFSVGTFGVLGYLTIYFGSLIGGNALALYIHRNNSGYRALGASGAVNGLIFAAIAALPGIQIFFIPGWLFGLGYILLSIYGIRKRTGNVGHDAHLGGAILGVLLAAVFRPDILTSNGWVIALLVLPAAIFMYLIVTRPEILVLPINEVFKSAPKSSNGPVIRDLKRKANSNSRFRSPEEEINFLLDKGVDNLSPKEKKRLDELSGNIRE